MDMINRWRAERRRRRGLIEDLLAQQDQQCPGRLDARERDLWDEERLDRLRHLVEEGHWGDEHTR